MASCRMGCSQEIKIKDSDTGLYMLKNNARLYLKYKRTIETYLKYKIFLIDIESGIKIYISIGLNGWDSSVRLEFLKRGR